MEPSRGEEPQFSMPLSDWLLGLMSYMMINLAQVSPPRQQVRIDGIQEDYPSSWAGGTLSEFGKSVPNQGPAVLGGVRNAVWRRYWKSMASTQGQCTVRKLLKL